MNVKSNVKIWLLVVIMSVSNVVYAGNMPDSVATASSCCNQYSDPTTRFKPAQLILPGALIAVGALGLENGWFGHIKRDVRDEFQSMSHGHKINADNYLQYLPAAGYLVMGSLGVKAKHTFKERALVTVTSIASYGILAGGMKLCIHERRPQGDETNSFPSGHTTLAFMGAELIRSEYPLGVGITAYAVACGVGFMRLYNDRHWVNDVIAGAGVGILCARIGYWMLPVWRRVFHLDRRGCCPMVAMTPFYDVNRHAAGASFVGYF